MTNERTTRWGRGVYIEREKIEERLLIIYHISQTWTVLSRGDT